MKTIRASDIGTYLYCRRAWMYRIKGYESINQAELSAGTELHRTHGRTVIAAGLYRMVGMFILLAALALFAVYGADLLLK